MALHFCPFCGAQHEKIPVTYTHQTCNNCNTTTYRNPIPASGVFIQKDRKLLLGKRKREPAKGKWDFIGGFMEPWETPEETATREVKEETGLDIKPCKLLLTYTDVYNFQKEAQPTITFMYVVDFFEGELIPNDDVEELRWFDENNLPTDMSTVKQLEVLEAWKNSLN
jgi:ADP-ribose pyrophosphatase YjhB (NUDIX family)